MTALRRWIPLIAVVVLAVATLLRALGEVGLAQALDTVAAFLGPDKILAGEVTAALAALIGVVLKVRSIIREIQERDTHVTPPASGARG